MTRTESINSTSAPRKCSRWVWVCLGLVMIVYSGLCIVGIDWGLPSRVIDPYLFGGREAWSGEKIYSLAGGGWTSPDRGADVDVDPLDKSQGAIHLNASEEDIAAIYLRYRLFTCQPDEMITMRALGGMSPGELKLDPKLYQYGGLFIYPVGGLLKIGSVLGLIDLRADVPYYLDHPEAFGRFYVVARGYVAAWGLLGILIVFAIARRFVDEWAGVFAAMMFAVLPVVIGMAHEAKPHLPGAVLMFFCVWMTMRYVDSGRWRDLVLLGAGCGAATGMVISSLPIFGLVPLAVLMRWVRVLRSEKRMTSARSMGMIWFGIGIGCATYLVTNPYIAINAFCNREVLKSNFGNSMAMYDVSRVAEGLYRVSELFLEGGGVWLPIFGILVTLVTVFRRKWEILPLLLAAGVLTTQFVLLGAGKPAEYGRFAIFPVAALAIAAGCGCRFTYSFWKVVLPVTGLLMVLWSGTRSAEYAYSCYLESTNRNNRLLVAEDIEKNAPREMWLLAEPAPYCCPPMDFETITVMFCPDGIHACPGRPLLTPMDGRHPIVRDLSGLPAEGAADTYCAYPTPISWANKPYRVYWGEENLEIQKTKN